MVFSSAAEGAFVVPEEGTFFTGEITLDGNWPSSIPDEIPVEEQNGILVQWSPLGYLGQTITSSDARFSGTRFELGWAFLMEGDPGPTMLTERIRIENADGAWTCVLNAVFDSAAQPMAVFPQGWCVGSDGYEGYGAYPGGRPLEGCWAQVRAAHQGLRLQG